MMTLAERIIAASAELDVLTEANSPISASDSIMASYSVAPCNECGELADDVTALCEKCAPKFKESVERICAHCGEPVNIRTWPGDEGFCSSTCRSLFFVYFPEAKP